MAYIIFSFNNIKLRIDKTDSEVEEIFEKITAIKIEATTKNNEDIEEIDKERFILEKTKRIKHPSVQELMDLIKKQSNFEFGSEMIREEFYHGFNKQEWKKAYSSIYFKIKNAMKLIEEQERGNFNSRKEGKFTYYNFIKDDTPPLTEYQRKE